MTCHLPKSLLLFALAVITEPVLAAPPANDNFINRATLSGTFVKATSTNVEATSESGEPFHAGLGGGKSVWYTWTAPSTGTFTAYLIGSSSFSNRLLSFYTGGSLGSLFSVASGSGGYDSPLQVSLSATSGTVYQIAIDGANPGGGAYSGTFTFILSQPPANENFANAVNLGSAASGTSTGWIDFSSTTEFNEPGAPRQPWLPGPRTVWWKWTAPATGFFTFNTLGADFDTVLHVYTGTAVNALTLVAENHDANLLGRSSVAVKATLGTTYNIRVSGETPNDVGSISLQYSQLSSPGTAAGHVALGRAHLQQRTEADLASADTAFGNALSIDANHAEANLLKAFTTFAMLEQAAAFQTVLTALGLTNSNVYARAWGIPKNGQGNRVLPAGTSNSAVAVNYLGNTMLPALTAIRSHLGKVSSPSFNLLVTDSETSAKAVLLDAGDISLIHASMHGLEAIIRLLQTYNAGVTVADVFTAANNDTLNVENVAKSFTNLLTFTGNDQRAAFKTALQSANTHYQAGSTFVRTTRADKRDSRHLFYLDVSGDSFEEEIRDNLQATSNSLNGAAPIGGETVNLAQAITSTKSLREQLVGLLGNKGIASTAPDPTFDGVVPNSTHVKVNRFLGRTGLLHSISNFSSWAAAFLGGQSVPNQAKSADPDKDMLTNFAEYAFNLNPGKSSGTQEYSVASLQTNVSDGKKYLHLSFVRRIDRATIDYVVAVSDNLTAWDRTGTQLQQVGAATANADGLTETVTVRLLADPLVTSRKFVRLEVSDLNP